MASKTVEQGLRAYDIGSKVRALRLRRKLGLVELGKHTGLSPALLSKIERSRVFPPLGTLLRIAMVFSVGLDYFFTDERQRRTVALVRKDERQRFPDGDPPSYFFESLDFAANERKSSSYLAEFQPGERGKVLRHEHTGAETIYLLSGRLALAIGQEEYELRAGDSIYFDSAEPHSYRRIGAAVCRGVVLTVG